MSHTTISCACGLRAHPPTIPACELALTILGFKDNDQCRCTAVQINTDPRSCRLASDNLTSIVTGPGISTGPMALFQDQ